MGLFFRIYGSADVQPTIDEIAEKLEENEFEIEVETGEDDDPDEETWTELNIYESSLDGAITLTQITDQDAVEEEIAELMEELSAHEDNEEASQLIGVLENCSVAYGVEVPEELEDEDNALVLCEALCQFIAQKCEGVYSVDASGYFNEDGDLIYAPAETEAEDDDD